MQRSKKIFIAFAIVFFLIILYVSIDISRRTTFPGSKGNLKERIAPSQAPDSTEIDE